uniref:Anoctaminlike protein putative n=1 Tax=Albugo laibachii Nc14 TaxID=890382 RepID=F0WLV4_9STRA|nr:anoctaminlike protein putative [Albugo laibachii Nc14]|eukprot:CCA22280.1 anoctaminlike protein putative [Albugo laibachii Nc14]
MHVVFCFDTNDFSSSAIEYFIQNVSTQTNLIVQEVKYKDQQTTRLLLGATDQTLSKIYKEKHAKDVNTPPDTSGFLKASGNRIDLIMYCVSRLRAKSMGHTKNEKDLPVPPPFVRDEYILTQAFQRKVIYDHFPLHNSTERKELVESWVKTFLSPQPLDSIKVYFGNEIGFYFAFLDMFSRWLLIPSILGVLVIFQNNVFTPYIRALYSLFITCWATAFLKFWKRRESTLRSTWNIRNTEHMLEEQERSGFWGERKYDPVQEEHFTFFSSMDRMKRYIGTSAILIMSLSGLLILTYVYFSFQYWSEVQFTKYNGWDGNWEYLQILPSISYSLVVWLLDSKYIQLASVLTDYENHRTDTDFSNALVLKLSCFYFVNNFASLFYLAFWAQDMERLEQTLSWMLITRQFLSNVSEVLVPYLTTESRFFSAKASQSSTKDSENAQVETELMYPVYDGTFDDYLELFVQFGQITLFASAFPLAAFCCLVNNLMEVRTDAFKLCLSYRRPWRNMSSGIGAWFLAFDAIGYLSLVTNCALIGMDAGILRTMLPSYSSGDLLIVIIVFEHVMVLLKACIEIFVPDIPSEVTIQQRLERALRRNQLRSQSAGSPFTVTDDKTQSAGQNYKHITKTGALELANYLKEEKLNRDKLEKQVAELNDLYLGWVLKERSRRKAAELRLKALGE